MTNRDDDPSNRRGRDNALLMFELFRGDVVDRLRAEASKLWNANRRPLSTNDVRHVLSDIGYTGDPRILGATFPRSHWKNYGWIMSVGGKGHARKIQQFVPRWSR